MTLEEMKRRKREFGYSNEKLAELSGVPLGTVQKVMSGSTKSPRQGTLEALAKALSGQKEVPTRYPGEMIDGCIRVLRMYQSAQRALGRICSKERGVYN